MENQAINITQFAFALLKSYGESSLTMNRLATRSNLSHQELSRLYPSKDILLKSLYPSALDFVLTALDLTSRDTIINSWMLNFSNNAAFKNVINAIIHYDISQNKQSTQSEISKMINQVNTTLPSRSKLHQNDIDLLIGYSIVNSK